MINEPIITKYEIKKTVWYHAFNILKFLYSKRAINLLKGKELFSLKENGKKIGGFIFDGI